MLMTHEHIPVVDILQYLLFPAVLLLIDRKYQSRPPLWICRYASAVDILPFVLSKPAESFTSPIYHHCILNLYYFYLWQFSSTIILMFKGTWVFSIHCGYTFWYTMIRSCLRSSKRWNYPKLCTALPRFMFSIVQCWIPQGNEAQTAVWCGSETCVLPAMRLLLDRPDVGL